MKKKSIHLKILTQRIKQSFFSCLIIVLFTFQNQHSLAQSISPWITTGDQSKLLEQQADVSFVDASGTPTITLDPNQTFQTIDGFGWTFTQGSAEVIMSLDATQQDALLNELFHPTDGLSSSAIRIGIGATDLSNSSYSYNETVGDVNMDHFSLEGPDLTYLIPMLKKVLAINPDIKILATPWTAPRWMKTSNAWVGGSLLSEYYEAYARYFIKYFDAMNAHGLNIWAITPQNEPLHDGNEPSMHMTATEQFNFVDGHLGPLMASLGYGHIKIIAYDHNCDVPEYPIEVCASNYVNGSAFHLYDAGANIEALSYVRNQTGKSVYFTEQYTGAGGSFSGDFNWHMQNVVFGSLNNWSQTVFEWNLATDADYGPHTPGGCNSCQGAITINSNSTYTRNVSYYIIGQVSKFIQDGAIRIGSSSSDGKVLTTAFSNPDGSTALLVYNTDQSAKTIKVRWNNKDFSYSVPGNSTVSFIWNDGGGVTNPDPISVTGVSVSPTSASVEVNGTVQPEATVSPGDADNKEVRWVSGNTSVATVNTSGLVTGIAEGSANITVTTQDGGFTASCAITVSAASVGEFSGYYNIFSRNSGMGLDVADNSTISGARIQQWEISNGGNDNQRWRFDDAGNGSYFIVVKSTQMCLAPENTSTSDGLQVQQKTCDNSDSQKWNVTSLGGEYYSIVNIVSGKSLDIEGQSTLNGGNLQVWDYFGSDNQQWSFVQVEDIATNISKQVNSIDASIYPNPAGDYLKVNIPNGQEINRIEIYSMPGSLVYISLVGQNEESKLNIGNLRQGGYLIRIFGNSGVSARKFIKK
jgi:glucosylceramidase